MGDGKTKVVTSEAEQVVLAGVGRLEQLVNSRNWLEAQKVADAVRSACSHIDLLQDDISDLEGE